MDLALKVLLIQLLLKIIGRDKLIPSVEVMQHFSPTTVIICDCDIFLIVTNTATEPQPRKACIGAKMGFDVWLVHLLQS
jgi:hypothetical protein